MKRPARDSKPGVSCITARAQKVRSVCRDPGAHHGRIPPHLFWHGGRRGQQRSTRSRGSTNGFIRFEREQRCVLFSCGGHVPPRAGWGRTRKPWFVPNSRTGVGPLAFHCVWGPPTPSESKVCPQVCPQKRMPTGKSRPHGSNALSHRGRVPSMKFSACLTAFLKASLRSLIFSS